MTEQTFGRFNFQALRNAQKQTSDCKAPDLQVFKKIFSDKEFFFEKIYIFAPATRKGVSVYLILL